MNNQDEESDPFKVAINYMTSNFLPDLIAIIPYSTQAPQWIFLRLIKVIQMSKYQCFFDDYIIEFLGSCVQKKFLLSIIKIFDLIILLFFVSHFFACIWLLIGYGLMINEKDGWIYMLY